MGIKQISTRTAGFDMFDLNACRDNGITVTNVTVYSPRAIAEMGLTHAMYLLRRIGDYTSRMEEGDFRWNPELISNEIYNQTVGIIGLGNIGGATAQIYKALGARVLAYDPTRTSSTHHTLNTPTSTRSSRLPTLFPCIRRCCQVRRICWRHHSLRR